MNVFYDTEFTVLPDKNNVPHLISLGCVAQDGREFYAELSNTWHEGLCSDFVVKSVLPLLTGGECRMKEEELAVRLKEWIEGLTDEEVILRSDSPRHDWPLIEYIFQFYGCWPNNLRRKCGTIYFNDSYKFHRFNVGVYEYWKTNAAKQHHALIDAEKLALWMEIRNKERVVMNEANTQKLYADFPRLYRNAQNENSSMKWGFLCGDGWFGLIYKLSAAIEAEAKALGIDPASDAWPLALQVKEKFGTLKFYCNAGEEHSENDFSGEVVGQLLSLRPMPNVQSIRALIRDAEISSEMICEGCGCPGTLKTDRWWRVLCDACEAKRQKELS